MSEKLSKRRIKTFQNKIFDWWKSNKRDLPWRETTNPYLILVSEVMLQQTQVSRTIKKYLGFKEKFPTIESLAKATKAEVLKMWSGLGYNRRAIWLHEAAQQIKKLGYFPTNAEELIKLKGIGPYTSKSILIFAFNKNIATVDTNIRRILIAEGFATEETTEKELFEIAEKLVPKDKSRDWHNALMDYGSIEKTALKTGIKPQTSQKKYDKSNRYYRGFIVKKLTTVRSLDSNELSKIVEIPEKRLIAILEGLEKDGLIEKKEKKYSLPK